MKQFAVIRIRGVNRVNQKVERTLQQLHLYRKNYCVIVKNTPPILGMLKKVKDYITWGVLDSETEKMLVEKRQEKFMDKEGKEKVRGYFIGQVMKKTGGKASPPVVNKLLDEFLN